MNDPLSPAGNDGSLVLGLEGRLVNAWPSFDYQTYDGWILRLANGYSKRANSASPFVPGADLDDDLLDYMVARFVAANVRPTFRLTSLQSSGVDLLLAGRGFKLIEPTLVLLKEIPDDCTVDPSVVPSQEAQDAMNDEQFECWWEAFMEAVTREAMTDAEYESARDVRDAAFAARWPEQTDPAPSWFA